MDKTSAETYLLGTWCGVSRSSSITGIGALHFEPDGSAAGWVLLDSDQSAPIFARFTSDWIVADTTVFYNNIQYSGKTGIFSAQDRILYRGTDLFLTWTPSAGAMTLFQRDLDRPGCATINHSQVL